jgi:nitrogen fixation/metabolism regulation signal transduction histidine kinase
MLSKKFYINVVVRILLIISTSIATIPFILKDEKLFTISSLIILVIIQVLLLLKYINRFNREVSNFFSALKTNDVSFAFHDKTFPHITPKFRDDINHIRKQLFDTRELIEIQQSYFKTVIENAQTGIITVSNSTKIDIINKTALHLLNLKSISLLETLKERQPSFYKLVSEGSAGTEKLINIKSDNKVIPLSVRITEIKQKTNAFKIISFQDIQSELDENELDSWHKLLRVLTHEINNTISPITSLADSIDKLLEDKTQNTISTNEITDDILKKTHDSVHIISQRGEGLTRFVDNYKNISTQKKLHIEKFKVAELYYNLELLMKNKLKEKNIKINIDIKPFDLEANADKKYLEQIFINLIKNAFDAVASDSGIINLKAYENNNGKITLIISDNGTGVPDDIQSQIFIPFFTTKTNGSGIGLSLARQIIRLHGGKISLDISEKNKTTFTIEL